MSSRRPPKHQQQQQQDGSEERDEEEGGGGGGASRRRKPTRACDKCRRNKHRCDGSESPFIRCTQCTTLDLDCTFVETSKRKAPPKGYVETLENRIAKMTELLSKMRPDLNLVDVLGGSLVIDPAQFAGRRPAIKIKVERSMEPSRIDTPPCALTSSAVTTTTTSTGTLSLGKEERRQKGKEEAEDAFVREFLTEYRSSDSRLSFLGKSSILPLLFAGIGFKYGENTDRYWQEYALHPLAKELVASRDIRWEATPNPASIQGGPPCSLEFLSLHSPNVFDCWPDRLLASQLIDIYFDLPNEFLPLLQKSHFLQLYRSQLYYSNSGFASLCLLVFAVGSLYCEDPRVRFPREEGGFEARGSAGWVFYHAFNKVPRSHFAPTDLCDLQIPVLLSVFLLMQSANMRFAWSVIRDGLGRAVDVGIHRRGGSKRSKDPLETDLYRRAFYCLHLLDIQVSSMSGRPPNLSEDSFDVELEFNPEFWKDGEVAPHGQPSRVQAFVLECQLSRILARVCEQLYGIKPPSGILQLVQHFDSELSAWLLSVPPHLKWYPSRPNNIDFRLSASLYLSYLSCVSYVHRPFLPSPQHPVSTSPASMASVLDASMASIRCLGEFYAKTSTIPLFGWGPVSTATFILVLAVWASKSTSAILDPSVAMGAVEEGIEMLEKSSRTFSSIDKGRLCLILLAAPRIDYLAESFARRTAREQQINAANALRDARERVAVAPSPLPSSSGTPTNDYSSPDLDPQGWSDPSFSAAPHASAFSSDSPNSGGQGGGGGFNFNAMFPDFFTFGNDPTMTLFPSHP
ncbi:fungal-specific transcription factor domain-containing protein [Mrakia frigida]|uniref:transcription factor domain-containing protein n=1 Tax=Mrakia frigida TaxID=29902 RepID=UPI003FCC21B2